MVDTNTQLEIRGQDYSKIILPLARQERSMLYDTVFVKKDFTGKSFYQDQIGTWEMSEKDTTNKATPKNDPNLSRTRIDIKTYHDARIFDRSVQLQTFSDPMSVASISLQSSVGIQIDKVIYAALGATALRGETGSKSVTLPTSRVIGADWGSTGTNTGLTVAKIRHAAAMLTGKGVPNYDRFFVASATGQEQLLGNTETASSDFNNVKALVSGEIDTFVGFKFKFLPDGIINVSSNVADYYAYHKTGVCFAMLEDLFMRITERDDLSYSKQVYYEISCGAARLEENKVVKVQADESVVVAAQANTTNAGQTGAGGAA